MHEITARVLSCEPLCAGLTRIVLHAPEIASQAQAGQFIHMLVPDGAHVLRRPISLMAFDRDASTLTLAIQPKGRGTQLLCGLRPGDGVQCLGPLGNGFDGSGAKTIYFVGGGVGVAPICGAMDCFATPDSHAFFGFRGRAYAYGMTQAPCAVTAVSDDGTLGDKALVTKPLLAAIEHKRPDLIMACGPAPMLAAVQQIALDRDIPCQLSLEERMGCGIGACLGCNVKAVAPDGSWSYKRVCKDGPVFDAKEVDLRG